MAVITSGTVTQSASGATLTFSDTTTGLVAPIVRQLTVYDPNGNIVAQPAFSGTIATINITADGWFQFTELITDANGSYTNVVNFLSTAFYQNAFANAIASIGSVTDDLFGVLYNLNLSQDNYQAALRMFIGGFGVSAQQLITQANFYVTTPYYA